MAITYLSFNINQYRRILEVRRRMENRIMMNILRIIALALLVVSVLLHISNKEKIKSEKQEFVLVGNLQNIYYIDTYDDLRKFSRLYNGSAISRDVNILVTSGIIFDDLFKKKEKSTAILRSNHKTYHTCDVCDNREDHILSSCVVTKYVLDDTDYVWTRVGKQCNSVQKDYIQSYILFEVEDLTDLHLNLKFIDPAHHYITAIWFDATAITFYDTRYYVHVYAPEKTYKVSSHQEESITTGHHWIFAVREPSMYWNKKNMNNLCKLILGKNIYISYEKV